MLQRLENTFGVKGSALEWFRSYLAERVQLVTVEGAVATPRPLAYGVPQGSVQSHLPDHSLYRCWGHYSSRATPTPLVAVFGHTDSCVTSMPTMASCIYASNRSLRTQGAVQSRERCIQEVRLWMLEPSKDK